MTSTEPSPTPPELDWDAPDVAALYDELPLWSAPFGLALLDRVPLRRGQTVLDVAAGTGFLTVELAQRCGEQSRVIAVDPWAGATGRLRDKIAFLGLTNVEVVTGPAESLPLADDSVDVVVSNLGINNVDDPAAVLRECARVMRPGATLVTTTNPVGHMRELYAAYRGALVDLGLDEHLPALEAQEQHRATVESASAALETACLEVTEVVVGEVRWRFADGRALLGHWFVRIGFLPGWRGVVPAEDADLVLAHLTHRLDEIAAAAGELALTIPTACLTARLRAPR